MCGSFPGPCCEREALFSFFLFSHTLFFSSSFLFPFLPFLSPLLITHPFSCTSPSFPFSSLCLSSLTYTHTHTLPHFLSLSLTLSSSPSHCLSLSFTLSSSPSLLLPLSSSPSPSPSSSSLSSLSLSAVPRGLYWPGQHGCAHGEERVEGGIPARGL